MPIFYDNVLVCDRYSCQGNSIRNDSEHQKLGCSYLKIFTKNCKLHIILYNAVYLHKLHCKFDCGNTIPCTNVLHKVCTVTHQVLLFCINTFRVTKDLKERC